MNNGAIQTILNKIRDTFQLPKKQFDLNIKLDYSNLNLNILDVIKVDYPAPFYVKIDQVLPIYGQAIYGASNYPYIDYSIIIDIDDNWKIIGKTINFSNETITLKVQKI